MRCQRRGGRPRGQGHPGGGATAVFVAGDVAKPADVDNAVAATLQAFGRIDVLVNNAGVVDDAPFLDLAIEEFDRVLGINLRGAFLMGQAVARQMVKQGKGKAAASAGAIVNMSSINEKFALPDHVAYSISKGGISQLTKAMAIALAPHGIRVNAVGPGTIDTPLIESVIKDKAFRAKVLSRTPLGPLRPAGGDRGHRRLARQRRGELRDGHHHLCRRRTAAAQLRGAGAVGWVRPEGP